MTSGCVAYNYDKIYQYCYLLSSIGTPQENPSFVSGPKFCPDNLKGILKLFCYPLKLRETFTETLI